MLRDVLARNGQSVVDIAVQNFSGIEFSGCATYIVEANNRKELLVNRPLINQVFLAPGRIIIPSRKVDDLMKDAKTLALKTAATGEHFSSAQIHDPATGQRLGGVVFRAGEQWYVIGVAGLDDDINEGVAVLIPATCGLISLETVKIILQYSGNTRVRSMLVVFNSLTGKQHITLSPIIDGLPSFFTQSA